MATEKSGIHKLIHSLRNFSIPDSQILQSLNKAYGSSFTEKQLKQILKAAK